MTEAEGTFVGLENFVEFLKTLPWCKQEPDVLVAVYKCTPEVLEALKDHEVKVYPGGMVVKLQKSVLNLMQEKYDEGQPLPVVIVWKAIGIEVWYRRHKSQDFPYDTWTDPAAAAYERERVLIPAGELGAKFSEYHKEILGRAKACPSMIPPQ